MRSLCLSVLVPALLWGGGSIADQQLHDQTQAPRDKPAKFCLFQWFGLTDAEKDGIEQMINSSDGSQTSRKAILDRYDSFCGGQEYLAMTTCLGLTPHIRDCLLFIDRR